MAGKIFRSNQARFATLGACFGILFPMAGSLIQAWMDAHAINVQTIMAAQQSSPLLWIIDTAPLFLSIFASFGGRQLDRLQEKNILLKERYQQMNTLREMADAANKAKGAFLGNMSHEIRTPMNAILGMSHLVRKTGLDEKQAGYLDRMDHSARSLLRIIDDILDLTRIEEGKFSLEEAPVILEELVADIAETMNLKLRQKREVEMILAVDPSIPAVLHGDPLRLRQVLLNLVDNAVKFTRKGEVKLDVRLMRSSATNARVRFSVQDSGIGMTPEQTDLVFKPFEQVDVTSTRRFGGTGLGLAITKHIVEMMGGELNLTTEPGKGSAFFFELEFPVSERSAGGVREVRSLQGMKVLLVDDSENARMVLEEMLSSLGFDVLVAEDAERAIEIFTREHRQDSPFQLLVVDWKMPGMDGLDLVRNIRMREGLTVPSILMVTAYGEDEVRAAAKNRLIDAYLLKPVNLSVLFNTLQGSLFRNVPRQQRSGHDDDRWDMFRSILQGDHVLLAEDNELNRHLALELLADAGVMTDVAVNGLEVLRMAGETAYDAILMDIQMPEMDGITATLRLRARKEFRDLPIIAMTAHAMRGEREKSLAAGMNDHITKPIDPAILYSSLVRHIHPDEKPIGHGPSASTEEPLAVPGALQGDIDLEAGLNRFGGKKDAYKKMLDGFVHNYADAVNRLNELEGLEDKTALAAYLHTLAGVSGNMGAMALFEVALDISQRLRSRGSMTMLDEDEATGLARIKTIMPRLLNVLQKLSFPDKDQQPQSLEFDAMAEWVALQKEVGASDPGAADRCRTLLGRTRLSARNREALERVLVELDGFEFAEAEQIIKTISWI